MGAISDFVAAFDRDSNHYSALEKRVETLCKDALGPAVSFTWQSRVKSPASLEKKLRGCNHDYQDEVANIADVKDLVAGRIILARWDDRRCVEKTVKKTFNLISRTQHPKNSQDIVDADTRFRGYGALHLYVTLRDRLDAQYWNTIVEIQVMTGFMWEYATLHHDVVYKQLHGQPTKELLLDIELLRGVANLGEIGLMMYDKRFFQRDTYPDLQSRVESVVSEEAVDELETQAQSALQLTNPRHEGDEAESSTEALEKRAYTLLRKHTRNKEAHLEGVAEAQQILVQSMMIPSPDNISGTRHLRRLHHLAVAERKLSLKQGLDTTRALKHLDQAEAYMDEAVRWDILPGLLGAEEQMTLERHIVRGLRAHLEFRMGIRNGANMLKLLEDTVVGINQVMGDLTQVDVDKFERNKEFALEWIGYFSKCSKKII